MTGTAGGLAGGHPGGSGDPLPRVRTADPWGMVDHAERGARAVSLDRTTASILVGEDLRIVWASHAVDDLIGHDDLVDRYLLDLVDDSDHERVVALVERAVRRPEVSLETLSPVLRFLCDDGELLRLRCRPVNLFADPDVAGLLVHLEHRVVEHRRDEVIARLAAGAAAEEFLGAVLRLLAAQHPGSTPGIWRSGPPERLHVLPGTTLPADVVRDLVARRWEQTMFRVPPRDAEGRQWWVVPAWRNSDAEPVYVLVRSGADGADDDVLVREDLERAASLVAIALHRSAQEAQLRRDAELDPLTGLANRRRFEQALGALAAGSRPWSVLMVDLDRFKPVNDTYGHATGDAVLRAIGGRLRRSIRPEDLVARVGGDEFAILVRGVGSDVAERIAARVRTAVEWPVAVDGRSLSVGCSIGIGVGGPGDDAAAVLADADRALYARKADRDQVRDQDRGRGRVSVAAR